MEITYQMIRSYCDYDNKLGLLRWKDGRKVGSIVNKGRKKYVRTVMFDREFLVHRLVWLWVTGHNPRPRHVIDHINGDGTDNRIENLREVTHTQNLWNTKLSIRNTSGYKGVNKQKDKWEASIMASGKRHRLGLFDTPKDASEAYQEASKKYQGEFARLNFQK
jgi:hypothetical protein